jgi:hypothetical protein
MKNRKQTSGISSEQLDLFKKLAEAHPDIVIKGATMPYTSVNGNMYSFLSADGNLNLRLPDSIRNDFMAKFKTKLSEQHGAILKEYVVVPARLFKDMKELKKYMEPSYGYASSLKPKATKKK